MPTGTARWEADLRRRADDDVAPMIGAEAVPPMAGPSAAARVNRRHRCGTRPEQANRIIVLADETIRHSPARARRRASGLRAPTAL